MAAYQCLNCEQIEHGEEDCCDRPDLFCINDMPGEILRLRTMLAQQEATGPWYAALKTLLARVGRKKRSAA